MLSYQRVDTDQTLQEGIAELRASVGPDHDSIIKMGPDMEHIMGAHDAVHVIFGCDASMQDEAISHFVMLLNTDVRLSDVKKVAKSKEHKSAVGEHKKTEIFYTLLGAPVDLWRVFRLRRKMSAPWPWFGYKPYLNKSIKETRNEFKIEPISRSQR